MSLKSRRTVYIPVRGTDSARPRSELATFHHNAQYQSQTCRATFLLNGIPRAPAYDEDYDMDGTQNATQEEEEGGDEVPQMQIIIVNEAELEGVCVCANHSTTTLPYLYSRCESFL